MTVGTPHDKARQFKAALVDAATTCTAQLVDPEHDLLVCYGRPSRSEITQFDDIVGVTRVVASIDTATMSATNRARELNLKATVLVSVFRPGGSDQEQVAGDRAYVLLDAIEEYVRVTDTTLGGLVRWCFCTAHESDGLTDPEVIKRGRVIEIEAEFSAVARISS